MRGQVTQKVAKPCKLNNIMTQQGAALQTYNNELVKCKYQILVDKSVGLDFTFSDVTNSRTPRIIFILGNVDVELQLLTTSNIHSNCGFPC